MESLVDKENAICFASCYELGTGASYGGDAGEHPEV